MFYKGLSLSLAQFFSWILISGSFFSSALLYVLDLRTETNLLNQYLCWLLALVSGQVTEKRVPVQEDDTKYMRTGQAESL